ncbi:MAG: class I SAM-dependent methyltransferase [Rhodothermales bacterium]|nr:class I SAM-dependent methyltransferase [Rhodothermales bacterium]
MTTPNWNRNLRQKGGFWKHGRWYDVNLARRLPLAVALMEELIAALPPLDSSTSVCDLGCGTGNAAMSVLMAYPTVHMTVLDKDPEMLELAREKISEVREGISLLEATVSAEGEPIPGSPYDVIIASMVIPDLIGDDSMGAEAETRYELLFQGLAASLTPGGHLFVADQIGSLGLYRLMKTMERAGFSDVDCAWRQDDFYICGGRLAV